MQVRAHRRPLTFAAMPLLLEIYAQTQALRATLGPLAIVLQPTHDATPDDAPSQHLRSATRAEPMARTSTDAAALRRL